MKRSRYPHDGQYSSRRSICANETPGAIIRIAKTSVKILFDCFLIMYRHPSIIPLGEIAVVF